MVFGQHGSYPEASGTLLSTVLYPPAGMLLPLCQRMGREEKADKEFTPMDMTLKHGVTSKSATRFRKGACENCGSITHKKIQCVERPRKIGCKYTGADIAPDEIVPNVIDFDFEAKRDRWSNYDVSDHHVAVEEHEKLEVEKRRQKLQQLDQAAAAKALARAAKDASGEPTSEKAAAVLDSDDSSVSDGEAEEKYAEEAEMVGSKFDAKARFTVRNLRIREDRAKYLHNLDPESAHYDPKTRTMRSNPNAGTEAAHNNPIGAFQGDNFLRFSGEVSSIAAKQVFAWDAADHGADVHIQAEPTKMELLHRTFTAKREGFKEVQNASILEKYGGSEYLKAPPKELLLAQSEIYVVYAKTGKIINGAVLKSVPSRYEEDTHPLNHTSVWGSYWSNGRWGFACCHQLVELCRAFFNS